MYYMIDNYDSFVYNLAVYFRELGEEVRLVRNDQIDAEHLLKIRERESLDGIILSPGPKSPADCGNCREILLRLAPFVPVLGVCLGHQIIGDVYGAKIGKGVMPMHGKITKISHDGSGVFRHLPEQYRVTRYHSLVVKEGELPSCLAVTARAADGSIQGIRHRELPVYGVQFHPEAVLTEHGHALLRNFTEICREWRMAHEYRAEKA